MPKMDALLSSVASLWKQDLEEYPLGWEVRRLPHDRVPSSKFWLIKQGNENFSLYKRTEGANPCFMIVLHNRAHSSPTVSTQGPNVVVTTGTPSSVPLIMYSVARFATPEDANTCFRCLENQLTVLIQNVSPFVFKESNLKLLIDAASRNPTYGPAHLLVFLGMNSYLKTEWIKDLLLVPDENGLYPIHVACKEGRLDSLKELIIQGCALDVFDNNKNTCLHYSAASDKNMEIIQLIYKKHPELLMKANVDEMTSLHVACLHDSIAVVKFLKKHGHPLSVRSKNGFPLHMAMKEDSQQCVEFLCEAAPEQLTMTDPNSSQGELPLHMAQSNKTITALIEHGSSTETKNSMGKTPLHVMCDRRNLTCVLRLLSCDANPNAQDNVGNTPMHCAVLTHKSISSWVSSKVDEVVIDLVRALLVFGGDPNSVNSAGQSVRHLVATMTKDSKLLRTLNDVGAARCAKKESSCQNGCSPEGDHDGESINPDWIEPDLTGQIKEFLYAFDRKIKLIEERTPTAKQQNSDTDSNLFMKSRSAVGSMSRSPSGDYITASNSLTDLGPPGSSNHRRYSSENILCLDGGGIRGLVLLLCLNELQKNLDKPIRESFDWMAGTSTGGIVALALARGFSIPKSMGIYFRFKDEVFQGVMRPYDHVPLEKLLKDYFTDHDVMTDIAYPKVLVSTVLGDRVPPDLFFFSNFNYPNTSLTKDLTHQGKFPPMDPPHKQYIWQVGRATSAAPTFFSPFGRLMDGGLMSNNPTLDVITEVYRIHQSSMVLSGHPPPKIGCVVSCGTGMVPIEVKSLSISKPSGIIDGIRSVSNLIQLTSTIIDQATVSEGRPVAQAQTWCQMCDIPYVRFNPPISTDTPLNETSDSLLLKFCWEALCFILRQRGLFAKVAHFINISRNNDGHLKSNSFTSSAEYVVSPPAEVISIHKQQQQEEPVVVSGLAPQEPIILKDLEKLDED